jgi:hypothetical protein
LLEFLRFSWHSFSDISSCEYRNKTHPKHLNFNPLVKLVTYFWEYLLLLKTFSLEWSNITHSKHLVKGVQMFFKLLLNINVRSTDCARLVNAFPIFDLKFHVFPSFANIITQLVLKFQLLICWVSNILNVFTFIKKFDL